MDISDIVKKLDLSQSKHLIRKAEELRRLSDLLFGSSIIGVGEICKAVVCLEIAASKLGLLFDRQGAIKLCGMSEKAYNRSYNLLQNGLGVKNKLDVRELAIQFGCVRLIPLVQKKISLYKERFINSLPVSRRASADLTRPIFTATAFYLCAKKHKLKVDKLKLIELSGACESEFSSVFISMKDLCYDVFGISKEKKDSSDVKGNRELLDALPGKRMVEFGGHSSDDCLEVSSFKRRKQTEEQEQEWKSDVIESNKQSKDKASAREPRRLPSTIQTLAMKQSKGCAAERPPCMNTCSALQFSLREISRRLDED